MKKYSNLGRVIDTGYKFKNGVIVVLLLFFGLTACGQNTIEDYDN